MTSSPQIWTARCIVCVSEKRNVESTAAAEIVIIETLTAMGSLLQKAFNVVFIR